MNVLYRWVQKLEICEFDLESAITQANCYLREVGGLDTIEEVRDVAELRAKMRLFHADLFGTYKGRTQGSQTSAYSACRFRRQRFQDEARFLTVCSITGFYRDAGGRDFKEACL